ncbi:tRNA pseudouridine(55) synthase TruB [Helicobacter sp. MIT 14-3879]|uniref:tRNA pseudouridine(55) synthase TruB n=1 Tax=Helicobacter sp. MIT 14-3879 TaxID=2040649 RepID=UPI000E1F1E4C|nr:tRNA pseudouridine(55) synthase TruB [Helicobacter sp. MIT 14-3879]RDU63536.1 tRNA pseudouridine(55) synthase TruB [Helicobacter sp. MIT 14-3879]
MLFVGNKPPSISSNAYLGVLKKKFRVKKLGYSGTLDPFASGSLVIASGNLTKIFNHINLSPKVYIATLWLGAKSPSLDISLVNKVDIIEEFSKEKILSILDSMLGKIVYTPPKFSAKKINGKRAYSLARDGEYFNLRECEMDILDIKFLSYNHPFLSFEVSVSKGAYVRSIGEIIANKLGVSGVLSNLIRIREGDFYFQSYKMLNPLDFIRYKQLNLKNLYDDFKNGKKIILKGLNKNTRYKVVFDDFFSIIQVDTFGNIEYIVNRICLC